MIIKAGKNLNTSMTICGLDKIVTLEPGSSVEVDDSWLDLPVVKDAISKNIVAVTNFCGFVVGEGVSKITVSDTPPVSPRIGDLWVDIS